MTAHAPVRLTCPDCEQTLVLASLSDDAALAMHRREDCRCPHRRRQAVVRKRGQMIEPTTVAMQCVSCKQREER